MNEATRAQRLPHLKEGGIVDEVYVALGIELRRNPSMDCVLIGVTGAKEDIKRPLGCGGIGPAVGTRTASS